MQIFLFFFSLGFQQALDMARRAMLMSSSSSSFHPSEADCSRNQSSCGHWPPSSGDCPSAGSSSPVLLAYVSRGLLSSLAEPRQVLELIALGQLCLQGRLVINTYALIDGMIKPNICFPSFFKWSNHY